MAGFPHPRRAACPDPARATAATKAMYGMRKLIIADLEKAAKTAAV